METERLEVGDHRLFVRTWNKGSGLPPVVLIHGLIVSSRYLIPLGKELARDFTVYAPDLPGAGRSSKRGAPLTVVKTAEVLEELLVQLELTGVTMVGHSYGCEVVAELSATGSERIQAAVFVGATVDPAAKHALLQCWRMARSIFREPWWFLPVSFVDLLACGPFSAVRWIRQMAAYDMVRRIADMSVPVAIVRGEHDHVSPRRWCEQMVATTGAPPVVEVAECGHLAQAHRPGIVAEAVRFAASPPDSSLVVGSVAPQTAPIG